MKHNKVDFDMLLKEALGSRETPAPELIAKTKRRMIREGKDMKKNTMKRYLRTAAAVAVLVLGINTTAFAAWHFLNPGKVAEELSDGLLSAAFDSDTAININQTIPSGGYNFTLLALVSGKDITEHQTYADGELLSDRTYAIVAIQKEDGSPMPETTDPEYDNTFFYISPYIKGLKPWQVNAHTLNGGHTEKVVDGVLYRIIECDEITMFADREIYLGINEGSFFNKNAFIYNEETGELKSNTSFEGISAVFSLPIDKSLADKEKADKYLENILGEESEETEVPAESEGIDNSAANQEVAADGNQQNLSYLADPTKAAAGPVKPRVLSYDEFKDWIAAKLKEEKALVEQGEITQNVYDLIRQDYEEDLQDVKNGAVVTLLEYADGSCQINLTFPTEGYDISIAGDGGIVIK